MSPHTHTRKNTRACTHTATRPHKHADIHTRTNEHTRAYTHGKNKRVSNREIKCTSNREIKTIRQSPLSMHRYKYCRFLFSQLWATSAQSVNSRVHQHKYIRTLVIAFLPTTLVGTYLFTRNNTLHKTPLI